ncbi:hypothetical protein NLI96_g1280 [Meripilus lineatus]|uniref:DUF6534 domain-containing protein n=1 Tax=Meripilus lineatus TaxID=2056292 RepID=A0AAD5YHM4_9APHY|nr:hypothetical protein NLI96_g1280 [Physisporinus lineatus]
MLFRPAWNDSDAIFHWQSRSDGDVGATLPFLCRGLIRRWSRSRQSLFAYIVTSRVKLYLGLTLGLASLCDVVIVASQYYFLRPARRPSIKLPESWFDISILHVLSRGTAFTILQLVGLVTFLATPTQFIWVLFHFLVTKVYANSLLAMYDRHLCFAVRHSGVSRSAFSLSARGISRGIHIDTLGDVTKSERELGVELGKVSSSPSTMRRGLEDLKSGEDGDETDIGKDGESERVVQTGAPSVM